MKGEAIFDIGGNEVWLTAEQAEERAERRGTCRECREPVRLHRKVKNGPAAHFEHLKHDRKYSLADQGYD
jgi:hypothetical protein